MSVLHDIVHGFLRDPVQFLLDMQGKSGFFAQRSRYSDLVPCLLRIDPLQEATYRCLMRLHAARNDRGAVSRTYQTCAAVLKRELHIEPGLTTRKTFARLMQAEE